MTLTDEQNDYIFEIHEPSNKSPKIAVEMFEREYNVRLTECTIRRKWKERELEIQAKGGYRNKSKRKSHSPLYHLPNNPSTKYLIVRARAKYLN